MSDGDCFPVAIHVAEEETELHAECEVAAEVFVVHGLPVGQGKENLGKRYWHAWVEVAYPDGEVLVMDRSNGHDWEMDRDEYYRIGKLDEDHVWRFPMPGALTTMNDWDTYGPWVEDWDDLQEVG